MLKKIAMALWDFGATLGVASMSVDVYHATNIYPATKYLTCIVLGLDSILMILQGLKHQLED